MEDTPPIQADPCRAFSELLAAFQCVGPRKSFDAHVLAVEILAKCGLCSEEDYNRLTGLIASSNIVGNDLEYLKTIAELGRTSVRGPRHLYLQSIARLKAIAPDDALLTYSVCEDSIE